MSLEKQFQEIEPITIKYYLSINKRKNRYLVSSGGHHALYLTQLTLFPSAIAGAKITSFYEGT